MQDAEHPVLLPEILEERLGADSLALGLRIPEGLAYFQGHFLGAPILPGIVQIHWAVHFAKQRLGVQLPFHHLEAIKFKALILPGQRLILALRWFDTAHKLEFNFYSEDRIHSSGRIYFQGDEV